MALKDRERELALIDELLEGARRGDGGAMLVTGEAGIGKSALLQVARQRADGMRALTARGGSLERDFGFGVVRQLFEIDWSGDAFEARHAFYRATIDLSRQQPLLLCVDDAHWADLASLHALVHLARRLEGEQIALLVAERTGEPGDHEPLLRALVAEARAAVVELGPLSAEAIRALYGDELDVEHSLRLTGGNPFLLQELVAGSSANVSRAVLLRLSQLGPDAIALAEAAAILDGAEPLRVGAALSGLDDVTEAADRLAAARILEPGSLRFIHPLVRDAVYRDIGVARRSAGHRRAAELLEEDRAAVHAEATEPSGDAWVAEVLHEAARRALARGAPAEAARLLRRALEEPPAADRRRAILADLGPAQLDAGDAGAAIDYLREAVALADDREERIRIGRRLALALMSIGQAQEALGMIDALIGSVARTEEERSELTADALVLVRHGEDSEAHLSQAREIVAAGRGGRRLVAALAYRDAISARGTADDCAALALRALGNGELLREAEPGSPQLVLTVAALILAEYYSEAERWTAGVAELAEATGSGRTLATWLLLRSRLLQARGDVDEAERVARRAVLLAGPASLLDPQAAWGVIISCLIDKGEAPRAVAELEAAGLTRDPPYPTAGTWAFMMRRAQLWRELGDADRALADAELAMRIRGGQGLLADSTRAEVLWSAGRPDEARSAAQAGVAVAERWGAPGNLGMALRVLGTITGDERLLERAVAELGRSERRVEHARALIDYGAMLRRGRRRQDAREPLAQGMELTHRCGATGLAARAREELVATGARPRRAVRTGVDALTPSELRVARLAAEGRTNREIAQALFVTPRTVQTHLAAIYRKLDAATREDLPAMIASSSYPPDDANAAHSEEA